MAAPIRFLSGRQQQQKIGIEGNTQNEKVLEVVGQVGIGTTIFSTDVELEVRGDIKVSGVVTAGSIDITGDGSSLSGTVSATNITVGTGGLNVDGQTDLDELVVAGVSTFSAAVDVNSTLDVDGDTQLDNLNVAGVATFSAYPSIDADNEIQVGTAIQLGKAGVITATSFSGDGSGLTGVAATDHVATFDLVVAGISTFNDDVRILAGGLDVTGVSTFNSLADVNNRIDVAGGANIDQVNTGVLTATSLNVTNKLTTTGIGISIANGTGKTAYIEGPEEIWIDPHPVGVATTSGIVRIRGDLYVDGTNFIVDSGRIELGDFRVGIATTISTNVLLDGAGLGIGSESIEKTITWNNATSALMSSENWNLASGKHYEIAGTDVLSATTLGSGVVNSSLTSVGTLGQLNVTGVTTSSGGFDGNLTGTIQTAAQTNITSLGTLSSLVVSGITSSSAFADFDYLQAPFGSTVSFTVTVGSKDATHRYNGTGSGQAYLINGIQSPFLTLTPGRTYRFLHDNTGSHPLRFYLEADKTTQYDTNVDFQDTYTEITVTDQTPTVLHYQCSAHPYMGNAVQTNSNILNTNYEATIRNGLNVTGVSTFTSAIDINAGLDVDGQADLDEVVVAGVATFSNDVFVGTGITIHAGNIHSSGIITALKFVGDGSQLTNLPGFNPEGTSSLNDVNVSGTTTTLQFRVSGIGTAEKFVVSTGGLDVDGQTDLDEVVVGGAATFSGTVNFNNGFSVGSGTPLFASGFNVTDTATFSSPVDINAGLDVDGQADLDEVVVAGLSTFNSLIDANAGVNIAAGLIVDQINSAGVATIGGDVSIADKIVHTGDTNTALRFPAADTFTVETNGSERLRITSGGNINFLGNLVNVNATGVSSFVQLDVSTGGLDVDGQTDLDELQVAGVSTFSAKAVFNTAYPSIDADNEIQVGTAIQLGKAGVITATTFSGNATSATTATNATNATNATHVTVTDNESTDESNLITFVENAQSTTGNHGLEMDGNLTYNPSSGTLSATAFSGDGSNLTGIGTQGPDGAFKGITVAGVSTFNGDVRIFTGVLDVSGVSTFSGIATHIDTLHGQTLKIAGVSTFSDTVTITKADSPLVVNVLATNDAISVQSSGIAAGALAVDSDNRFKVAGRNKHLMLSVNDTGGDTYDIHMNSGDRRILTATPNGAVGVSGIVTATALNVVAGSGLDAGNTGVITAVQLDVSTGGLDVDGQTDLDELVVTGVSTFHETVNLGQSDKLRFNGTTGLEIYENGSVGIIQANNSSGRLQFSVNGGSGASGELIQLKGTGNLKSANFRPDSNQEFFSKIASNTSALRLETRPTGVAVVGIATASGISVVAGSGLDAGATGVVTAVAFHGDGSALTGVGTAHVSTFDLVVAGISTFNNTAEIRRSATNSNPHLRLFAGDSNGSFVIAEHASSHPDLEFKTAAGGSTLSLFRGAAQNTVGGITMDGIGLEDNKSIIFGTGNDAYMRYDPTPGLLDINTVVSEPITLSTNNVERLRIAADGLVSVSGIVSATGINVVAGTGLTAGNTGVITAVAFHGDGSALTGIAATAHVSTFDLVVAGISTFNDDVRILAGGLDVTGVVTATQLDVSTGGLDVDGQTDLDELVVAGIATFQTHVELGDSDELRIGDGDDLQIWHNGSNSFISNTTGNLNIRTTSSASDININSNTHVNINLNNGVETAATFTANGAVALYHNGISKFATSAEGVDVTGRTETDLLNVTGIASFTQIDVSTGGLDVDGQTDLDELVVAGVSTFSDDVTFTGASYNAVWDKSDNALEFAENAAAKFGEDADLEIYHATHSYIKNKTGSTAEIRIGAETVRIGNVASTETYIKGDENGEVILYHDNVAKLNTNIGGITVTGGVNASGVITATQLDVSTGGLDVDGETQLDELVVAGVSTFNDDVKFSSSTSGLGVFYDRSADTLKLLEDGSDNTKLTIGDNSSYSSYIQMYHDGGNSGIGYINYAGSNKMILSGNNITFMNTSRSENMLTAVQDGAVSLYHNNLTRLATSAEGIDVTGRTETDLLNVTGIASFTQIDLSTGGLDVDGQTDLDELVVAGVSTFSAAVDVNSSLDVDGQTDLDELQVAGVSTFSAKAVFNTAYPSIDADNEIQVGTAIQLGKAGVITATSFVGDGSELTGIEAGGSPEFYTGITSSRQITPLSFESTVFTFPSTSGKQYVIESINVANVDTSVGVGTTINIIASIQDATAAEQTYIAYNVPIVTGGLIELLKNPIVAGPSDVIRMWTTNTAYVGLNNAAEVYMNFTEYSDSTDFISKFASTVSVASTNTTTLYTSTSNPTMIEKIGFANRTDSGDFPVSVKITNGTSTSYLAKNLIIPRYSTVDILDRHKRIETGATIDVEVASTSTIDIIIAGKKITS